MRKKRSYYAYTLDLTVLYTRILELEILRLNQRKILGFYFDSNPNAVCHVRETITKFYNKLWTIRFLKRSGMSTNDLLKVYFAVIRSAVEYCSVVYHSLIPNYMSDKLESLQKQAMKIIFGPGVEYDKLVNDGIVETLEKRRKMACTKFAQKAAASERFGPEWFLRTRCERMVRGSTRRTYQEGPYRRERDRNNPIQYMVRLLNEH